MESDNSLSLEYTRFFRTGHFFCLSYNLQFSERRPSAPDSNQVGWGGGHLGEGAVVAISNGVGVQLVCSWGVGNGGRGGPPGP